MKILSRGSRGEKVKQLQRLLNIYPDGFFGILTEEAVKDLQRRHGLTIDGIVGSQTWAVLNSTSFVKSKRTISEIIVHCTASPEGKEMTVEDIRNYHKAKGWSDIGYHYVVYLDGTIHTGRDIDIAGAHCQGHNQHSIGVCYVGGLANIKGVPYSKLPAKDTRTDAQKKSLVKLLKELKQLYPKAKIYGHRDFASKDCPSFDAEKEYRNI